MKTEITLSDAQAQVDQWIKTVGVRYFNELTNMTILMEEVGNWRVSCLELTVSSLSKNLIKVGTWEMRWQMCFGC